MASPFSWPVLVPCALRAPAPVNLGVRPRKTIMSLADTASQTHQPTPADRFTAKHVAMQFGLAIFLMSSNELDRILNLYLLVVPLMLAPCGVVAAAFIYSIASSIYNRHWRLFVSALAAPPIVAGILGLLAHYKINPDWLRFQLTCAEYKKEIATDLHARHGPRTWSWGETGGAAVVNVFKKVVYDESDGVINEAKKSTPNMDISVRSFGDHFYLVTTIYP
jgi:hypothetical protein